MTLSELESKINAAIADLSGSPALISAGFEAGQSIIAQIADRIRTRGLDSENQPFTPYSTNQLPAFFYIGKSRTTSANNAVKQKAKKKETLSYADFRQINGLKTDKKNFEFTGEMFRELKVLSVQLQGTLLVIEYGGGTKASEDKFRWNSEQEGESILKPAKSEISIAEQIILNRVKRLING